MDTFEDIPYAQWLEDAIRVLTEHEVKSIGLVALIDSDEILTAYYHAGLAEKSLMATHINVDAMMDAVLANAKLIVATAENDEATDEDE